MVHFRIGLLASNNVHRSTSGEGSSFKTAHDFSPDLVEVSERLSPHHIFGGSVGRNNIRCVTALGDNPVDTIGGPDMLSQQPNGRLGDGEGISGVDALLGEGRGVRSFPRVVD